MKVKDDRTRNWTFVLYPESMADNAFELLRDFHIPCIVSPCHNKDIDKNGELKKPHYHVMLCFSGPKSYDQVINLITPLGANYAERVHEANAMARYFAHLDEPDKVKYPISEYQVFGGLDLYNYLQPTRQQVQIFIGEMQDWIRQYNIYEFCDLLDYAKSHYRDTWYYALCNSCSNIMVQYIKSFRNKKISPVIEK